MSGDTCLRPGSDVMARNVGDRAVLLDGKTGSCYELNSLGAQVWARLDGRRTLAEVCRSLAGAVSVSSDTLDRDVESFAGRLVQQGLAEIVRDR